MSMTCVICHDVDSPDDCTTGRTCGEGEVCYASLSIEGKYTGDCRNKQNCHGDTFPEQHLLCCDDNLMCNKQLFKDLGKRGSTSTTTTTTTTTAPVFVLSKGLNCHVCSGPECGVSDKKTVTCPDSFPYCMNTIQNSALGDKLVTKRCASHSECADIPFSLNKHGTEAKCASYDGAEIYLDEFDCVYCCQTAKCNHQIVPPFNTQM